MSAVKFVLDASELPFGPKVAVWRNNVICIHVYMQSSRNGSLANVNISTYMWATEAMLDINAINRILSLLLMWEFRRLDQFVPLLHDAAHNFRPRTAVKEVEKASQWIKVMGKLNRVNCGSVEKVMQKFQRRLQQGQCHHRGDFN